MSEPRFSLRRLALADLAEAQRIEAAAYRAPAALDRRELTENRLARCIVAWERIGAHEHMRGMAGLWCIVEEGHVITVAVEPRHQGRGIGRLLLHGLVDIGRREAMRSLTLEVRRSNAAAQALYRLYGFWPVGERLHYYDDGEDAIIMTTEGLTTEPFEQRWLRLSDEVGRRFPGVVFDLPPGSDAVALTSEIPSPS
jgi:ribosomal-protein-alanine N-acetyltransferase